MSWKVDFSTDSCRKMPFGQVIHTMGQVQPSQGDEYAITAKADGIVSINGELTEGKSVKAGQTLFSIESGGLAEGNLDVRYQEAENNYLLAKAEYERKQSLAADNIVSSSDLQQAKTRYENAKTLYQNLKRNFFRHPCGGTVCHQHARLEAAVAERAAHDGGGFPLSRRGPRHGCE